MTEIQPYGEEWVKEMMRFKKLDIIKILRGAILNKEAIIEAQRAALKEIANSDAINTVFSQYDINDVDGPAMSEARIIARAALEEEV